MRSARYAVWGVCLLLGATPSSGAVSPDPFESAIARYRTIADRGGWTNLSPGPPLKPGDRSPTVATLRERLIAAGDHPAAAAEPTFYDERLVATVRDFQRRHGIRPDGVVGDATRKALNVPVRARLEQLIRARVQRMQAVPAGRWIRINVPEFRLQVLDGTRVLLEMPVVVGRASRPTPLFEKPLSAIVFNPSWTVPPDLAYHDILPKIIANPHYLAQRRIDVYESWKQDAARIDPARIDWKRLGRGIEDLMLRQRPGPGNGLGRMMFRMDGEQEIFLHDTPAREVFRQDRRDLSSGCIRVADAEGLARAVLDDETRTSLPMLLARKDTVSVTLAQPIPVRTVYDAAWIDPKGAANFRDDVYAGRTNVLPPVASAPPPVRSRTEALVRVPRGPAVPPMPQVTTSGRTRAKPPWMRPVVPGVAGLAKP